MARTTTAPRSRTRSRSKADAPPAHVGLELTGVGYEALGRLPGVERAGEEQPDAVVCRDPADANGLPCLLTSPESCCMT